MSLMYRFDITIEGASPRRKDQIEAALKKEWAFEDLDEYGGTLSATGDSSLYASCSESVLAERLAQAVWQANGGYCQVQVQATCLESLPYTEFVFDDSHYGRMMESASLSNNQKSGDS